MEKHSAKRSQSEPSELDEVHSQVSKDQCMAEVHRGIDRSMFLVPSLRITAIVRMLSDFFFYPLVFPFPFSWVLMGLKDSGQGPKSIGISAAVQRKTQLLTDSLALPSSNTAWPKKTTEVSTLSSKLTSHCAVQNPCRYPRVFEGHIQKARGAPGGQEMASSTPKHDQSLHC